MFVVIFSIFWKMLEFAEIDDAGGVRRHVASICDGSVIRKSTFGKKYFSPKFGRRCAGFLAGAFFFQNQHVPGIWRCVLARICGYINPEVEYWWILVPLWAIIHFGSKNHQMYYTKCIRGSKTLLFTVVNFKQAIIAESGEGTMHQVHIYTAT